MSSFTTPLIVEAMPGRKFKVAEDFTYYTLLRCDKCNESPNSVTVPKGFITDMASIPRILWVFMPPHGTYGKAAVLHDYCYENAIHTKKWADSVFYEAMSVLGVPRWKRRIMYAVVKFFGKGKY
jgi:hypothetical protein